MSLPTRLRRLEEANTRRHLERVRRLQSPENVRRLEEVLYYTGTDPEMIDRRERARDIFQSVARRVVRDHPTHPAAAVARQLLAALEAAER